MTLTHSLHTRMRRAVLGLSAVVLAGLSAQAVALTPQAEAAKTRAEAVMTGKVEWKGPTTAPKPLATKRIAVISCCQASEGAARPARAIVEAGRSLGWKVDVFDGKGDPQEQNKALNAAVDSKYDGIALVFVDTPVVSDGVKRALGAKIPLITLGSLTNTPASIPDISHDWVGHGRAIADYMIWKSDGKVDLLLLKNTDLNIVLNGQYKGTFEVLNDKAKCPQCKVLVKDWALSNLDTQPASIASATLQANPNTNWVWCFDACMSRVSRSMAASGLGSKVRGAGFDCNGENVQLIKDGTVQQVCAADPRDWEGYALIDNINRMMQGQPAIAQNIPIRMFDRDTIASLKPEEVKGGWQGDYDFRSAYKKLWGVK
jgi:ribose transport system substrate-binding protein